MPRPSILRAIPQEALEQLQARVRLSPQEIARLLGCRPSTIYRHFPGGGQIQASEVLTAIDAAQERGRKLGRERP